MDVSYEVGAPWRCGVLTTWGGIAVIGSGHLLWGEHDSTLQSGAEAPRLLKRSVPRLDHCCCVLLWLLWLFRTLHDMCVSSLHVYGVQLLIEKCPNWQRNTDCQPLPDTGASLIPFNIESLVSLVFSAESNSLEPTSRPLRLTTTKYAAQSHATIRSTNRRSSAHNPSIPTTISKKASNPPDDRKPPSRNLAS